MNKKILSLLFLLSFSGAFFGAEEKKEEESAEGKTEKIYCYTLTEEEIEGLRERSNRLSDELVTFGDEGTLERFSGDDYSEVFTPCFMRGLTKRVYSDAIQREFEKLNLLKTIDLGPGFHETFHDSYNRKLFICKKVYRSSDSIEESKLLLDEGSGELYSIDISSRGDIDPSLPINSRLEDLPSLGDGAYSLLSNDKEGEKVCVFSGKRKMFLGTFDEGANSFKQYFELFGKCVFVAVSTDRSKIALVNSNAYYDDSGSFEVDYQLLIFNSRNLREPIYESRSKYFKIAWSRGSGSVDRLLINLNEDGHRATKIIEYHGEEREETKTEGFIFLSYCNDYCVLSNRDSGPAFEDKGTFVYDLNNRNRLFELGGQSKQLRECCFSNDSRFVASIEMDHELQDYDKTVRKGSHILGVGFVAVVREVDSGEIIFSFPAPYLNSHISFSSDNKKLYITGYRNSEERIGLIQVFDFASIVDNGYGLLFEESNSFDLLQKLLILKLFGGTEDLLLPSHQVVNLFPLYESFSPGFKKLMKIRRLYDYGRRPEYLRSIESALSGNFIKLGVVTAGVSLAFWLVPKFVFPLLTVKKDKK
ncbi:hypothetical protein HN446_04070 [bacterium]|jgi:hypothetical protein|nr:hypothetical protein [bacterium]